MNNYPVLAARFLDFGLVQPGGIFSSVLATTAEFLLDGSDRGGPDEGLGILIPGHQEDVDRFLQIRHAAEHATAYGLVVEVTEASLHQIEPTGTGRSEVRHKP